MPRGSLSLPLNFTAAEVSGPGSDGPLLGLLPCLPLGVQTMSCCESFPSTEQPGSSGNGRPLSRGQGGPGGSVSAPVTPKTLSLHGSLEGSPAQVHLLPLSRFPHLGFPRPFPRRGGESKPSLQHCRGAGCPLCPPSASDWTNNPIDRGTGSWAKTKIY